MDNGPDTGTLSRELGGIAKALQGLQNSQDMGEGAFPLVLHLRVLAQSVPPLWRCNRANCGGGFTVSRRSTGVF